MEGRDHRVVKETEVHDVFEGKGSSGDRVNRRCVTWVEGRDLWVVRKQEAHDMVEGNESNRRKQDVRGINGGKGSGREGHSGLKHV